MLIGIRGGKPVEQPRTGSRPITIHCTAVEPEYFCNFRMRQSAEISHFHDPRSSWIDLCQGIERLVDREECLVAFWRGRIDRFQSDDFTATALGCVPGPSVIH